MSNQMFVSFPSGKRVVASYSGFEIATDQNPKNDGDGSAPEPYDLFLASLATCAGYYVLSFCQKRQIPHDGIRLVQSWQRNKEGKIDIIRLAIEVPASFPDKYHGALVRAANQCAVKKTLDNPPGFEVETIVA